MATSDLIVREYTILCHYSDKSGQSNERNGYFNLLPINNHLQLQHEWGPGRTTVANKS